MSSRLAVLVLTAAAGIGASAAEDLQTQPFRENFDQFDTDRWYVSDGWANGEWQNCTWSNEQVGLKDGVLTLDFSKRPSKDRTYSCAEIQTHKRFGHGTFEARFKTDSGSGINAAFFTYIGPAHDQPHDEIDFEILTKDTSSVDVNTYVSGNPKNGHTAAVPGGSDSDFNTYSFVWEKERLRWYVNGVLVHTAPNPDELPVHAQKIYLSHWGSDTLEDWMGPFSDPERPLTMQVDWVAYTPLGEKCQFPESVVCDLEK